MRRLLVPLIAAGAILAAGAVPASAAAFKVAASSSNAAGSVPSGVWKWVYKNQWPTYNECHLIAQTYGPLPTKCVEYTEGDYFIWKLFVFEPTY